MCRSSLKVGPGGLQHGCTSVQRLSQVEIQAGEMPAGLRACRRTGLGAIVQQAPAVPVVAAFGKVKPTTKQRKVSRRYDRLAKTGAQLRSQARDGR